MNTNIEHNTQPTSYFFWRNILPYPHNLLIIIIFVVTALFSSSGVRVLGHLLQQVICQKQPENILWF
jgi:hypothetical protein